MSRPLLTICIATIPDREEAFERLHAYLTEQCEGLDADIHTDDRPRGSMTIGAKRQFMNEAAEGKYVVHIDDDDWVPPDYVSQVCRALKEKPDVVGHYELVEGLSKAPQLAMWTNKAPDWLEGSRARPYGVSYVRTPFHKTPMRRDIALEVGIADMHDGEDHDFSRRLKKSRLIRTEAFVPRVLYYYRYEHMDRAIKFGIK